jgi:pimeloyl-ACP methyl ester carboxylesterase
VSTATNPNDGTVISYDASGEGPAVVLLHGSALSKAIWRGLGYLKALGGFTTLRVDLRGHGRSDKPHEPEAYAMPLVVEDVVAVLDAAGVERAQVVGYSFGSRVGFALASERPERVASLVSLGGTYQSQRGQVEKVFFPGYLEALRSGGMPAFADGFAAARDGLDPTTRAAFLANDAEALAAYFEATEAGEGVREEVLARMSLPVLLMAGTLDLPRLEQSRRAAALMPRARFVELPGRTHASTLFPAGPVLEELVPFLREHGRGDL